MSDFVKSTSKTFSQLTTQPFFISNPFLVIGLNLMILIPMISTETKVRFIKLPMQLFRTSEKLRKLTTQSQQNHPKTN